MIGSEDYHSNLSAQPAGRTILRPLSGVVTGGGFFEPVDRFSWYLFVGVSGRAVAYDIFLDGNAFRDSPEVDRRPLVADAQGGLVIQLGRYQLGLTVVTRTEEFETQRDRQVFGAISLSMKL